MNANMETLSRAWADWAAAASWQIALLVVLVAIAAFLSRRLSARFRYLLWMLVIIKALTPPSLGTAWSIGNWAEPRWGEVSVTVATAPAKPQFVVPPSGGIPASAATPELQRIPAEAGTTNPVAATAPVIAPSAPAPAKPWSVTGILLLIWSAGFVALASFILFRYWRLTCVLSRAAEADEGPLRVMIETLALRLGRDNPPDLLLSDHFTSPFLFGLIKPRIVLPTSLPEDLTAGQLEDVLLHELIHWRRRDLLSGWLQILVQALFWFHPLVWFAGAQLRHERECACDEAALESGCSQARRYGESLLKVLLAARGRSAVAMGFLGIFERNTRLQRRLEEIMNQETRVRRLGWWGWVSLAVFAILCLPMAALSQNGGERGAGFTPLHMAAQNGHLGTVKVLIDKGADVNARSETGLTPLHLAAQGGHQDTAAALIKSGADINAKDNNGNTPLTFASENGHQQLVENLINKGAEINPKWTPRPTLAAIPDGVDKAAAAALIEPTRLLWLDAYREVFENKNLPAAKAKMDQIAPNLKKLFAYVQGTPLEAPVRDGIKKFGDAHAAVAANDIKRAQLLMDELTFIGPEVASQLMNATPQNSDVNLKLSYVPDSSNNMRSLGASGHAVIFDRPTNTKFIESVWIYTSRYGTLEPPNMDFHLYVLNDKYQVLSDLRFPYSTVQRGPMSWVELKTPSIEVPERFVIALAFNPDQSKGVYLGLAPGSRENPHSVVGTPGNGFEPMDTPGEWMVRATLSDKPSGKEGIRRLADWKPPVEMNPFKGLDSVHYDDGNVSDENKQSYGGRGPAINFNLGEFDLLTKGSYDKLYLKGFRLYAGRYGSGYDPEATKVKVAVLDSTNAVRWQGEFPYSLFKYKSGWVDLPLSKPVPASSLMKEDRTITIAFDPEAHQTKGIYFHYTKNPKSSHSSAGKIATGFKPVEDREWAVRAYFTNEETTPTSAPVTSSSANDTEWADKLTNNQRLFMQWTDRQFDRFLDRRDFSKWQQVDRDELLKKCLNTVGGPQTREYYEAIGTLGAIGDKSAVPALLKIATDRVGPDCRDNWMAARSLGMIGDASAVSDLIHLSYHTNTNVHFWAQISLVRLTGQNFGYDWKKWGEWWNAQGGQPPFTPEKIRWWDDPKFEEASTADALAKADNEFLNKYFPGQVSAPPTGAAPAPMQTVAVSQKAAWSALQATGEPDTDQAGDIPTAWASLEPDMGEQWLELDYNPAIRASMVRIHETFNPGAVTKVILYEQTAGGISQTEIPVTDDTKTAPAFCEVRFPITSAPVVRVRVVLDTNKVHGWNEIDAVQLWGPSGRAWASDARASSSYADRMARTGASNQTTTGKLNWSALQATGAPDTMQAGDIPTAWASYETDQGEQWLELDYNPPLRANKVRIHETYNPGAVTRVIVKENSSPSAKVLADVPVNDKTTQAPAFLEVSFETTASPVGCVRIVLDTNKVHGWNEIDAVELVGPDGRAWATDARASSSFADRFTSQAAPAPAKQREADAGIAEQFKSQVSAPQILSITPSIGQTGVDPDAVREIVVTFDRDMGGGFSWTGGGPDFPQSRNNQPAFWRDKRTCVKPVTLQSGRFYRLGINSTSYQNFKSAEGVPVEPVSIYFTTKGARAETTAQLQKPQVVSMDPANGAIDVDPNITQLRVTFSVPMGGGFSWVGGGENYPEVPEGGRAQWSEDRKTCILPVKLKPGWQYHLGLNSSSFTNFMSEAGIPLDPVAYGFRTK